MPSHIQRQAIAGGYAPLVARIARGRRLPRKERGFTLVELLIAMTVALVIFGATLQLLAVTANKQISVQTRVTQLSQAQVAIARLVRDLRQASSVTVNSNTVNYSEPGVGSVGFSCSAGTCTRTDSRGPQTAITNVANSDVFTALLLTGVTYYVGVKLVISAPGHTSVTLSDGADLRNVTLGK